MRSRQLDSRCFFAGLAVGLGGGAVTFMLVEALRRPGARRSSSDGRIVIDGARSVAGAALDVAPPPEQPSEPLESEAFDVEPDTQRW
jgi:hypothetical protein